MYERKHNRHRSLVRPLVFNSIRANMINGLKCGAFTASAFTRRCIVMIDRYVFIRSVFYWTVVICEQTTLLGSQVSTELFL